MCGIVGFSGGFQPEILWPMSKSISHRGPDGNGSYYDQENKVGLAHRRLAIIDLSPAGHQPMASEDGQVVITFNGEIYNFQKLREKLLRSGWSFRGTSDTEVLLALYRQEGVGMLEQIDGIFSFAIWDKNRRELFLARDGLGVKPLYYSETSKGFIFASELKALLQEESVSTILNPIAIARYLTFLWSPSPETILSNTFKVKPGFAMLVADGRIVRNWQYYDLPNGQVDHRNSLTETQQLVRETLEQAVSRQMVGDVPVGAFLSGGLDSSAVVAMARRYTQERLQCFTIGFSDEKARQSDGMVADLPFARRVAEYLDVDLHVVTVGSEITDHLEEMIFHLDEPQADPAALNALFISKLAREHGIKVLLSGAGGDDIFTGYRRHYALQQEKYWSWMPSPLRRGMAGFAGMLPVNELKLRRLRKAFMYAGECPEFRLASYFFWVDPKLVVDLFVDDLGEKVNQSIIVEPLLTAMQELPKSTTDLEKMLYLECKYFLADHNLNYTDKMSMAHGVEVRVPLLDLELISLAATIPSSMKQRGVTGKWIFKKSMEGILPSDVIYRPKSGFGAPLRYWLHNDWRDLVTDTLSKKSIEKRGLFNFNAVNRLLEADRGGRVDAAYTIFSLICIELWCRRFLDCKLCKESVIT